MEKKDFESMWAEMKDLCKPTIWLKQDMEKIEKKHTVWEPEHGEWVWDPKFQHPYKYVGKSGYSYDGEYKLEPLSEHLPILEYGGFKVGERVPGSGGVNSKTRGVIESFVFRTQEVAKARIHWEFDDDPNWFTEWDVSKLEHLPPPEPDEFTFIGENGGEWKYKCDKEMETVIVSCNDEVLHGVRLGEIDKVREILKKCKARLERE